jgi:hypothetical protein
VSLALVLIGEGREHDLHCNGNLKERAAKAALSGAAQLLQAAVNSSLIFGTQRYVHSNYAWRAGSVLAFQEVSAAGIVLYMYSIILHHQIKSGRVTSLYHVSSVVLL